MILWTFYGRSNVRAHLDNVCCRYAESKFAVEHYIFLIIVLKLKMTAEVVLKL